MTNPANDINKRHSFRLGDAALTGKLGRGIMAIQQVANDGAIEKSIQELVKIRASQINGCAYCLAMHWRDAIAEGERVDRLSTLDSWREADWFTPRERAALLWTEAITNLPKHGVTDELYAACRDQFSEEEMADLTACIIAINSWNRLAIGFSTRPEGFDFPAHQG